MPDQAPKLFYPPPLVRQWQPALRSAAAWFRTLMHRITDEAPPWTYDNAPPWLQRGLNWMWHWGALTFIGFLAGLGFSVAFL